MLLQSHKKKNMGSQRSQKESDGTKEKRKSGAGDAPPPVNIMGGLRYHDKKRMNFVIKKGNADVFYEQLQFLNKFLLTRMDRAREFHKFIL